MTQERFRPNIPPQDLAPRPSTPEVAADQPTPVDAKPETAAAPKAEKPTEHGGPKGLDPTRYGDWERKGRCVDF